MRVEINVENLCEICGMEEIGKKHTIFILFLCLKWSFHGCSALLWIYLFFFLLLTSVELFISIYMKAIFLDFVELNGYFGFICDWYTLNHDYTDKINSEVVYSSIQSTACNFFRWVFFFVVLLKSVQFI